MVEADVGDQPVEPDGLVFDATTLKGALIKEDADYEGIRVTFLATLQNARVPMQLDLGYGDVVVPAPKMAEALQALVDGRFPGKIVVFPQLTGLS